MHNKKKDINKSNNFIQGLRPLSSSLPHGFKKILRKGGYNFSNIVDNWTKMIGKDISEHCYPETIKMNKNMNNGVLILNVLHGNEINIEYKKQDIIDKINSFFGYNCISQIKLKIVQTEKNPKKIKKFIYKNSSELSKKLNNIKNQDLKKSLGKLIKAYGE